MTDTSTKPLLMWSNNPFHVLLVLCLISIGLWDCVSIAIDFILWALT